ncbi:hypothetical protein K402DRAFT_157297 [Aulographum hederae CBS 113979]|uniref:Uncharacterized protein n=1 Tax=Aulographum hederae CBS 113979 TaxID=1176131 RepID=A0A6G1GS85_9PEZI|nr:hypothetical protein K402DRAFT_157297 [Aulographum hederae CBS 113979]
MRRMRDCAPARRKTEMRLGRRGFMAVAVRRWMRGCSPRTPPSIPPFPESPNHQTGPLEQSLDSPEHSTVTGSRSAASSGWQTALRPSQNRPLGVAVEERTRKTSYGTVDEVNCNLSAQPSAHRPIASPILVVSKQLLPASSRLLSLAPWSPLRVPVNSALIPSDNSTQVSHYGPAVSFIVLSRSTRLLW